MVVKAAGGRCGSSDADAGYGDMAWVDAAGRGSVMGRLWVDCGSQPPADADTAALRPIRNTDPIRVF